MIDSGHIPGKMIRKALVPLMAHIDEMYHASYVGNGRCILPSPVHLPIVKPFDSRHAPLFCRTDTPLIGGWLHSLLPCPGPDADRAKDSGTHDSP